MAARFKFDGDKLKSGGTTIANVRREKICKGTGSTTVANVRGDKIRGGTGGITMFNIRGDKIRKGTGGITIADMDDVDDAIDGPGGITKAALWLFFVK